MIVRADTRAMSAKRRMIYLFGDAVLQSVQIAGDVLVEGEVCDREGGLAWLFEFDFLQIGSNK